MTDTAKDEPSSRKLTIAIDGPAGAGKSTIASRLARKLGYVNLESGAMYRALALKAIDKDASLDDEAALLKLAPKWTAFFFLANVPPRMAFGQNFRARQRLSGGRVSPHTQYRAHPVSFHSLHQSLYKSYRN